MFLITKVQEICFFFFIYIFKNKFLKIENKKSYRSYLNIFIIFFIFFQKMDCKLKKIKNK